MLQWLEKIRGKSENTRRLIVLFCFCVIGGTAFLLWYWTIHGRPISGGLTESFIEIKQTTTNGFQRFQNFRIRLGEIKRKFNKIIQNNEISDTLFNSLSSYESEAVGNQKPKE
ncbi:MAG: hypothetical protein AAB362_00240 [Patescibacteria group bacterium]